jgi:AcrR family transcriptional regulator
MTRTQPDRRIVRTRELVLDAFRALMVERGYEKMTVQHVLNRSGVGRATLYAHFKGKEDLLEASIGRLQEGLRRAWAAEASGSRYLPQPLGFSRAFLEHVESHRRIYDLVVGKSSEVTIDRYMRRMLVQLAREDLLRRPGARRNPKAVDVASQFIGAALWSLVVWWLSSRPRLPAAELDSQFRALVLRGLDQTLGSASSE